MLLAQSTLSILSQEEYTPVYDQNLTELQPLDARVVTHVTKHRLLRGLHFPDHFQNVFVCVGFL
jgi:hypothetical protein